MKGGTILSGRLHPPSMPRNTPVSGSSEVGCSAVRKTVLNEEERHAETNQRSGDEKQSDGLSRMNAEEQTGPGDQKEAIVQPSAEAARR